MLVDMLLHHALREVPPEPYFLLASLLFRFVASRGWPNVASSTGYSRQAGGGVWVRSASFTFLSIDFDLLTVSSLSLAV
jgi:hypothetical protein